MTPNTFLASLLKSSLLQLEQSFQVPGMVNYLESDLNNLIRNVPPEFKKILTSIQKETLKASSNGSATNTKPAKPNRKKIKGDNTSPLISKAQKAKAQEKKKSNPEDIIDMEMGEDNVYL